MSTLAVAREFFERALEDARATGQRSEERTIALRICEVIEMEEFNEVRVLAEVAAATDEGAMGRQGGIQQKRTAEPLRGVERVEFARVALEEAVGRMVKFPTEQVYVIAVMSRWHELDTIRDAVLRPLVPGEVRFRGPGRIETPMPDASR